MTCNQNCGSVAVVYAIDPRPGGWGGYYCAPCTGALGFQIVDRLADDTTKGEQR